MPESYSREVAEGASAGTLEIVKGAGHLLALEDPEGTLDTVLRASGRGAGNARG